ncbi:MAG: metallophosphoesterase [Lachnospiraceae bacterium]|nr:metallophosphoesterase [Lachnospiraceae bacterium]
MLEILISLAAVVAIVLAWVSLYDTHHFVVVHNKFSDGRIKKSCRFVMLSDLHGQQYGRDNEVLLQAVKDAQPQGILLVGDMITAHKKSKPEKLAKFLADLQEIAPVYYANGNHEQKLNLFDVYGDVPEKWETVLKESGVYHLVNEHIELPDVGIGIYGTQIGHEYFARMKQKEMPKDYMQSLLGKRDEDKYSILLAHNPDYFENYAAWGADLVLSGHVHGGIMRLPFLGGVIAPSLKLFPKYDGGIFTEGKSTMVLGRGIGTHSPNVRFFNPGELIVLEFDGEN